MRFNLTSEAQSMLCGVCGLHVIKKWVYFINTMSCIHRMHRTDMHTSLQVCTPNGCTHVNSTCAHENTMHLTCNTLMYVHIDITHYRYSSRFLDFIFNAVNIEHLKPASPSSKPWQISIILIKIGASEHQELCWKLGPVFRPIKKNRYNFTPLI